MEFFRPRASRTFSRARPNIHSFAAFALMVAANRAYWKVVGATLPGAALGGGLTVRTLPALSLVYRLDESRRSLDPTASPHGTSDRTTIKGEAL